MNSERLKVLEILAKGSISAEEAERLLTVLDEQEQADKTRAEEQSVSAMNEKREARSNDHLKGKKLRVDVKGNMEDAKNINVDVSVPLVLARYADDIISNLVPNEVDEKLQAFSSDSSVKSCDTQNSYF